MKRVLITIGALVILSLTGVAVMNQSPAASANPSNVSEQTNEQTQIFAIDNMTCPACPFTVKKAMARVDGVTSVTVDFAAKTATALFSPTLTTAHEIAAASTDVGYPATPIER